jgi:hypothetical protein
MSSPKKILCFNCGKEKTFSNTDVAMPSEYILDTKDIDGMPIFTCGGIKSCRFKIDPISYMKNRDKDNFAHLTVDADLDFSDWDFENLPTKKIKRSVFSKIKKFL